MTTENEELVEMPDRNIGVLLNLDTYQGMSDSEIQSVIDWYVTQAEQDTLNGETLKAVVDASDAMVAANEESNRTLMSMVESIMNRPLVLQTVEGVIADE